MAVRFLLFQIQLVAFSHGHSCIGFLESWIFMETYPVDFGRDLEGYLS